jgi:hypothetical protein
MSYKDVNCAQKIHEIITPYLFYTGFESRVVLGEQELLQIDEAFLGRLLESDPDALLGLSIKLTGDLKEALERLNQNPSNSSKPSGSQAPWDKGLSDTAAEQDLPASADDCTEPSSQDDEPLAQHSADELPETTPPANIEKPKRKPGKQPGAPGFGRVQKLAVTDTIKHHCLDCSVCNTDLSCIEKAYTGFYTIDIEFGDRDAPGVQLTNTHHIYYAATCPKCGLDNRSEPWRAAPEDGDWQDVGLTEWRLIGPSLAAMIVYLAYNMRISRRLIKVYFDDIFGLTLCIGSIQKSLTESARALAPVEAKLINDLVASIKPLTTEDDAEDKDNRFTDATPDKKSVMFVDETSHPEAGDLYWLWIFITATTALYKVGKRSRFIFDELLAISGFNGWLMSDGYLVYRHYEYRLRCWAHLLRKAQGLSESYTRSVSAYGHQMFTLLDQLMEAIYQAREGPNAGCESIMAQHTDTLEQLKQLCKEMSVASHKKTYELGREFLNDWDAIFRVLEYPAWPLTNNTAERGLRHWVILRLITQGTRGRRGSLALALSASVITTCRLRNSPPLLYIRDVITLRRQGKDVPELPPVP